MLLTPHDYQVKAAEAGIAALREGRRLAIVSPTGSGKSVIHGLILQALPDALFAAPTIEICLSVYQKLYADDILTLSEAKQFERLQASRLWTIKKLHNALMSGALAPPKFLLFDEGHHTTDDTHTMAHALTGECPAVMLTATYFRGTPNETAKLRAKWGEPYTALTLREAVDRGVIARPDFRVWPLLNDETIKVTNGEFETRSVEGAIEKVLPDLVDRVREALYDVEADLWLRPTMFTCPGVASSLSIRDALRAGGLPAESVHGDTPNALRQEAFSLAVARRAALVQVNVVSEGVDLPIRVGVDLAPTMSPVRFMQGRIGRITRPVPEGEDPPQYICTNHNITRHSYLWAGLIPPQQVRDAQKAWGPEWKPTRRHMARALGLEGFGRFTVSAVPMLDGTLLSVYALQTPDGLHQYTVLINPNDEDPLYFERTNKRTGEVAEKRLDDGRVVTYNVKDYGPWTRIASVPSAEGYVTIKPGPITEPMLRWWKSSAKGRGLDPEYVPNWREWQALPVLVESRTKFRSKPC